MEDADTAAALVLDGSGAVAGILTREDALAALGVELVVDPTRVPILKQAAAADPAVIQSLG